MFHAFCYRGRGLGGGGGGNNGALTNHMNCPCIMVPPLRLLHTSVLTNKNKTFFKILQRIRPFRLRIRFKEELALHTSVQCQYSGSTTKGLYRHSQEQMVDRPVYGRSFLWYVERNIHVPRQELLNAPVFIYSPCMS